MGNTISHPNNSVRRPRLWPGIVIVALYWAARTVPSWVAPGTSFQFIAMFFGPMVLTGVFLIWWLLFSRLPWTDVLVTTCAAAMTGAVAYQFYHQKMRDLFPMSLTLYVFPYLFTAWVVWLLITWGLRWPARQIGLIVVLAIVWAHFTLIRFDGTDGEFAAELNYRWKPTPEERFFAEQSGEKAKAKSADVVTAPLTLQAGDWPGFRGPNRDGRLPGVRIATNWEEQPPKQLWRHRVGPGWSSFAVIGDRIFTQEQRGEDEIVVCYDANTGNEVWVHRDQQRFDEAIGGPGPRATPTFHEGKILALGAKGRLNCFETANGKVVWTRDIVKDSGAKVPMWGFSASPLVVNNIVSVFAGGPEGKSVLGYNFANGDPAWSAGDAKNSYCSTQLLKLSGVDQLVICTDAGATSFEPSGGAVLWNHEWPLDNFNRVVQPALVGENDVLIGTGFGNGTRRVHIDYDGNKWSTKEIYTSRTFKPYYNDFVIHKDHLYGIDNGFLMCVRVDDGQSEWKVRGYGSGQVLLLPDQDMLLIVSEKGEVALVDAVPDAHKERAKFQAISGKTWNHPVVAHGKLFVRNGEEAACFELRTE